MSSMPTKEDRMYFFPGDGGLPIPIKPKTRYETAKEGWGDRKRFQGSYGLGMDPDGFEEGNEILDLMRRGEYVVDKKQQKRDQAEQQRCEEAGRRQQAEQQHEADLRRQQAQRPCEEAGRR